MNKLRTVQTSDDFCAYLLEHCDEIVQVWASKLGTAKADEACKPPRDFVRNARRYLTGLAEAMSSSAQAADLPRLGETWCATLEDYRLLQLSVFEFLDSSATMSSQRRDAVLAVVHRALAQAVLAEVQACQSRIAELSAVIECIPAAVLIGNIKGATQCNTQALRMFGVSSVDELNKDAQAIIDRLRIRSVETGELLPADELASACAVRGQYVLREEIRHSPVLNADVVVQVAGAPLHLNGQLSGGVVIITDITRRKQAEQQLQESESRFRLLTDEQKRALERLREERELREKFVFALTHDLRTPLTAVKAGAQLMRRYPERVEIRDTLIARIISDVERADQMIRDLLDANRIRAGQKLPLVIGLCDLVYIARDTLRDLALIHDDRFTLVADCSDDKITGFWSAEGLRRVIENLASNAVKYGDPHRNVVVKVAPASSGIFLSVHNHGNPLSAEEQGGIFRAFHRTKSAQRSRKKGWGIGLTLVRGIVEAHGGSIRIERSALHGTTFTVDLPLDSREVCLVPK